MDRQKKKNLAVSAPEAAYQFQPDDFTLRGGADDTRIDTNFASENFWKEVRKRFFKNKGAVVSLIVVLIIGIFAAFGPNILDSPL